MARQRFQGLSEAACRAASVTQVSTMLMPSRKSILATARWMSGVKATFADRWHWVAFAKANGCSGTPIVNVEGGCATGSLAFPGAYRAVISGQCDVAMAVGVEKTWFPDDPAKSMAIFTGGIDQLYSDEWRNFFVAQSEAHGQTFEPHPYRVIFLDIHALQAKHMQSFGTTPEQIAYITTKNRTHALLNERAQYRRSTTEDVLNDKMVIDPLTRSMCSPISDGAAAVLVCSERFMRSAARTIRAIRIRASHIQGGQYRDLNAPSVVYQCARKAYAESGIDAKDVHIAEVHDATSSCELLHYESLGFCPRAWRGVCRIR